MKVLKEMKWLIIAAVAIVASLLAMYFYQMKVVTHLSENAYAVTDDSVLRTLKNQSGEEGQELKLTEVAEQEPVYLRLGSMYVGTKKVEADAAMPFFVNDGASALFMLGDAKLYNGSFETVPSFTGMYLADGVTYNYDKSQADDDTFYFAGLTNGLFLNAKSMTINIPGKKYILPMNSVIYMDEENISYYRNDNGVFTYGTVMTTSEAEVTIGDMTIGYEDLLGKLGLLSDKSSSDLTVNGNTQDSTEVTPEESNKAEILQPDGEGGSSEAEEEYPLTPDETQQELDKSSQEIEQIAQDAKDADEKAKQEEASATEDNHSGNANNSNGALKNNAAGGSGDNSSSSGSTDSNSSSDSKKDNSDKPSTPADGNTVPGEEVKVPFVVPSATLSDLTTDIYSLSGKLAINDPSGALRRVTLELYWPPENDDKTPAGNLSDPSKYQLMYRRTYRTAGNFTIDNLPPGTTIYIKGTLTYYTEGLETKTITFYDSFESRVTTLAMSTMDPIYIDFEDADTNEIYQSSVMQIYKLRLSGPNKNVLKKVNKAVITVKATDLTSNDKVLESSSLSIGNAILNRDFIYKEEGGTYKSDVKQLSLPSNARIDYEVKLYDTFGNQLTNVFQGYEENQVADNNNSLKVVGGNGTFRATGTTYTCKSMPTVEVVTMSSGTTDQQIDRLNFQLTLTDPHNAIDPSSDLVVKLYKGTEISGNPVKTETFKVQEILDASGTVPVSFTELTAGSEYCLAIYGDYNLNDNHGEYKDALLVTANASTIALSSYGRVNYTLAASHVKGKDAATGEEETYESATAQRVSVQVNEATTKYGLFQNKYVDSIKFAMTETGTNNEVFSGTLQKETLDKLDKIVGGGTGETLQKIYQIEDLFGSDAKWTYTEKKPQVILTYTDFTAAEQTSVWDVFTWGHNAILTFDFGEGSLNSFTPYQLYLTTYAKQGADGDLHDVSGRTNVTRRVQFTTLRKMPELEYKDFMIYSDQMNMYELYFHDPDKAIYNGQISVNDGKTSKAYTISYDDEKDGYVAEINLSDLRIGSEYEVTITADQIRRSSSTAYRYADVVLFSTKFIAGDGINGTLTLQRLSYALVNKNDTSKSYLKEDFDLYNGGYTNYYLNGNSEPVESAGWYLTDYLPVEPGKVYYFDRVRNSDSSEARVSFYDADKKLITNSFGYIYNGSYIQAPEGAAYIRYSSADSYQDELCIYLGGCYQMQMEKGAEIVKWQKDYTDTTKEVTYTVGTGSSADITFTKGQGDVLVYTPKLTTERSTNYTTNPVVTFYDESGNVLSQTSPRRGVGVEIPDNAAKVTVKASYAGSLYVADGSMKAWLDDQDMEKMQSVTSVYVKDTRRNLVDDPKYTVTVYKDDKVFEEYDLTGDKELKYETENSAGVANAKLSMDCKSGSSYKIVLTTEYRGKTLLLDTLEYKANIPKYVIGSAKDVYKLVRYKTADFIVTGKLDIPENSYIVRSHKYPFNGSIDFQNNEVNVEYTSNDVRMFRTLGSAAVLENLQLNVTMDATLLRRPLSNVTPVTYQNYGTIRNIIVNLNLGSGYYQKNDCAGIARYNYGTIENFALYYGANSYNYVGNRFGGLVVYNYGAIKNGMVYSPRWLQAISGQYKGDTSSADTSYVGGVAAINYSGSTIENVYGALSLGVERDKRTVTDKSGTQTINLDTNGTLVGYISGGRVVNSFVVGDMYEVYWKQSDATGVWGREYHVYEKYTPLGSGSSSDSTLQGRFLNSFYFGQAGKYSMDVSGYAENGVTTVRLTDQNFYNSTVNKQGQFHVSDISQGFYPRVEMNSTLLNLQQRILYNVVSAASGVTYVGATVTEQTDDYADVTLAFNNALGYTISDIKAGNLLVNGQTAASPDTPAEYEQYQEGNFYYVKVRVWPNGLYRDSYKINSFGIGLGSYHSEVTNVNRSIGVSFYKPVSMDNWLEGFTDVGGNYRLVGDIDINGFQGQEAAANNVFSSVNSSKPFTGKIEGNGHVIKNIATAGNASSIITYTDGAQIRNLTFENVTIGSSDRTLGQYAGIIGYAKKQTRLENVFVKNAVIHNPYQYAGSIVGYLENSSMTNCGVQGMKSEVTGKTTDLRLGGMIGYNVYSTIENCYAAGVNINVSSTQANVIGVGGISGDMTDSSSVRNAYTQGKIYTTSGAAGGITGQTNGSINRCWSKTDISGSGVAAGIVGRAQSSAMLSQLLAVGNISGQANATGRIAGTIVNSSTTLTNSYAYAGQKIQGEVSTEALDTNGLMSADEMKVAAYYWNNVNLGYSFRYTDPKGVYGIEQGYLPMLNNNAETELLPNQNPTLVQLDNTVVSLTVDGTPTAILNGTGYDLNFTLRLKTPGLTESQLDSAPESFYDTLYQALGNLSIPGMKLDFGLEKVDSKEWTKAELWSENTGRFEWDGEDLLIKCTNSCVAIEIYRDTYQAVYGYTDATGTDWEVSAPIDFGKPLYMQISSVYDDSKSKEENRADLTCWYGAMKAEGKNYQNFMITEDLDFSKLPDQADPDLINLNINRLVGKGYTEQDFTDGGVQSEQKIKDYLLYGRRPEKSEKSEQTVEVTEKPKIKITEINVTTTASSQRWINVLQGTMEGITISDAIWNNSNYAGTMIGLIGKNTGTIRFVDFENIKIMAGSASNYVGAVGYNQGTLEYVRVKDADISNNASTVTHRVGGLVGISESAVTHCSVVGSGDDTYNIKINSNGNSDSQYTGGLLGYCNNYVRYCYADKVNVSGRNRTGGLAGYANNVYGQDSGLEDSIRYNPIFYYIQVSNSNVVGKYYTGGIYGSSSDSQRNVSIRNTITQQESGSYSAGGITGIDGYTLAWHYVEGCTIKTAGNSAGGIIGYSSPINQCIVSGCTIEAKSMAGGLTGSLNNYYVIRSKVENCNISAETYAGGLVGFGTSHSATGTSLSRDCAVLGDTVISGTGANASYIGGIAGAWYSNYATMIQVDESVKVTGYSYVGGAYGIVSGGEHYGLEIGATVEGSGNYAGGFAGEVIGYTQSILSPATPYTQTWITLFNPKTEVRDLIVTGKVKGNYYVGGFAGLYDKGEQPIDPDNGEPVDDNISGYIGYLNQKYFKRILIAPTVIDGNGNVKAIYNNAPGVTEGDNSGIGYLRIYDTIDGGKISAELAPYQTLTDALGTGKKFADEAAAAKTYLVNDTDLSSPDFYYGNTLSGSMNLMNSSKNRFFDTSQMNKDADGKATTFPMIKGYDYSTYLVHGDYTTTIDGAQKTLYYLQWVFGRTNGGVDNIRSGALKQDGILLPANAKAADSAATTAVTYALTDADIAAAADTLSVYASGIDTINIDVPAEIIGYGLTWQMEDADGNVTASGEIDDLAKADSEEPATITLHYDFNTYLTLQLCDEGEALEVYAVDPASLARTVASGSEDLYYIRKDGVVSVNAMTETKDIEETEAVETSETVEDSEAIEDSETVEDSEAIEDSETVEKAKETKDVLAAEGNFVHLYGEKALTSSGEIVDLLTGTVTDSVDKMTVGTACVTAKAAYTTYTKSGSVLDMYSQYSLATTDGVTAARDFRLFAKQGQTFAVDVIAAREDGAGIHDIVADVYRNGQNDYQYLSYLTADGSVKDLGDKLHWPKELSNSSMGEIAGNINGTQPILLVRYQDNTVAAFQYMTGKLLVNDTTEKKEIDFLQYATIWLANLKAGFRSADNTAYLAAVKLTGDLKAEPVDTDLALNVTGTADNVSDEIHKAESADRITAGSNLLQGVYNAAAANWKAEALKADSEKGKGFLSLAEENLSDAMLAFAKNGTSDADGTAAGSENAEGSENAQGSESESIEVTEKNAAEIKEIIETAFADDTAAQKLKGELTAEGFSDEQAQQMYGQYVTELKKSVDEAAAYNVSEGASQSDASDKAEASGTDKETGHVTTISNDSYVIAMNSETGEYEVYSEKEMLDTKKESAALMSENQKLVLMKEAGLLKSAFDLDDLKVTAEENRQGLILIAVAAAGIGALLIVMYRKRRKMQ